MKACIVKLSALIKHKTWSPSYYLGEGRDNTLEEIKKAKDRRRDARVNLLKKLSERAKDAAQACKMVSDGEVVPIK